MKSNLKITPQTKALIHAMNTQGISHRKIAAHTRLSHTAVAYALDPAKAPWRRQSVRKYYDKDKQQAYNATYMARRWGEQP